MRYPLEVNIFQKQCLLIPDRWPTLGNTSYIWYQPEIWSVILAFCAQDIMFHAFKYSLPLKVIVQVVFVKRSWIFPLWRKDKWGAESTILYCKHWLWVRLQSTWNQSSDSSIIRCFNHQMLQSSDASIIRCYNHQMLQSSDDSIIRCLNHQIRKSTYFQSSNNFLQSLDGFFQLSDYLIIRCFNHQRIQWWPWWHWWSWWPCWHMMTTITMIPLMIWWLWWSWWPCWPWCLPW